VADAELSFERFVVGPGNQLAAAAARRAAEAPGAVYNPLLIWGGTGIGKTHLLHAIGKLARLLNPDAKVHFESAARLANRVTEGIVRAAPNPLEASFAGVDLLLIDEVEQLVTLDRTREEFAFFAARSAYGGRQLVLSSLLPPAELGEVGEILASGLAVEIEPADPETLAQIARLFASDLGSTLPEPVLRALAAHRFGDLRRLRAAVAALADLADTRGRPPDVEDARRIAGDLADPPTGDEFGSFLADLDRVISAVVETAPWRRRIAEAILRWEADGIRTRRLDEALHADIPPDIDALLEGFAADAMRLIGICAMLRGAGMDATLDDPDRLDEAERLLVEVGGSPGASVPPPGDSPAVADHDDPRPADPWFLDRERLVIVWSDTAERIVEDPR
jgi:hypothetical protein